jgi:hypothetical protein
MTKTKNYQVVTLQELRNARATATNVPLVDVTDYYVQATVTTPNPVPPRLYNRVGVIVPPKATGGTDATSWTLVTKLNYTEYTDVVLEFYDSVYLVNSVTDQTSLDALLPTADSFVRTIVPCSSELCDLNYDAFTYVVIKYATQNSEELDAWVTGKYHSCFIANTHNEGLWAVTNLLREDGRFPNFFSEILVKDTFSGISDQSVANSLNALGYSCYSVTNQQVNLDYFNIAGYPAQVAAGSAYLNYNIKDLLVRSGILKNVYSEQNANVGRFSIENFLSSVKSRPNSFISDSIIQNGQLVTSFTVSYTQLLQSTSNRIEGRIYYKVEVLFSAYINRITLELNSLF